MGDFILSLSFRTVQCYKCKMLFAMTIEHDNQLRNSHETFYCPAGHNQHYTGQSDLEKERQARQRAEQNVEFERQRADQHRRDASHQERRASTFKGHCTRIRKKVVQGQCPCGCDGVFANLRRHMAKHHPNWQPDAEVESPKEQPHE